MLVRPSIVRSPCRTPLIILLCGCLIGLISFGPRSTFGFFLMPMSAANGWGRDVFSLALALEMLLWGASQLFAVALADKFGAVWVPIGDALLYIVGTAWMAFARSPLEFELSAGVLIGLGLGGCLFTLVIGAFGKLMPPNFDILFKDFFAFRKAGLIGGNLVRMWLDHREVRRYRRSNSKPEALAALTVAPKDRR